MSFYYTTNLAFLQGCPVVESAEVRDIFEAMGLENVGDDTGAATGLAVGVDDRVFWEIRQLSLGEKFVVHVEGFLLKPIFIALPFGAHIQKYRLAIHDLLVSFLTVF